MVRSGALHGLRILSRALSFSALTSAHKALARRSTGRLLHRRLQADTIICHTRIDRTLRQRYNVRYANILKICGHPAEAFKKMNEAFEDVSSNKLAANLSYPAYRTGCVLAAERGNTRDFNLFISRAQSGIDSGNLSPHDVATVFEGLADAYTIRFQKTNRADYRDTALAKYAEGQYHFAAAEKHAGGKHIEFSLRFGIRPLTFYKAGISDFVSVTGMSLAARSEELARELLSLALETSSERTAQRLQQTLQEITA